MKSLSSITQSYFSIPKAEQHDVISFVFWPIGGIQEINPSPASEISCGVCEGNDLVTMRDPSCEGLGVLCMDCTKNKRYPRKQPPKKEIKLYGLPAEFENASFELLDEKPRDHIEILKTYAQNAQGFLLMAGKPGLGKTYASACVMRSVALKNVLTRYVEFGSLYQQWLTITPNWLSLLETLQKVSFLIVDDFGHKTSNPNFTEFLHLLFNYRKSNNKPTIVITNLIDSEVEDNTSSAILSRIASGIIIKFDGKDRRRRRY